jgi:hypothetical protein
MKSLIRNLYFTSGIAALLIIVLLVVLANTPWGSPAGILLAPGMLLGAIFFPEGAHSDWARAYIALAGILDVALLALLIVAARKWFARTKSTASRR